MQKKDLEVYMKFTLLSAILLHLTYRGDIIHSVFCWVGSIIMSKFKNKTEIRLGRKQKSGININ